MSLELLVALLSLGFLFVLGLFALGDGLAGETSMASTDRVSST